MNWFLLLGFGFASAFVPERLGDAMPAILLLLVPVLVGSWAFLGTGRKAWLVPPVILALLGLGIIAANAAATSYSGPQTGLFSLILPAMMLWPPLAAAFTVVGLTKGHRKPSTLLPDVPDADAEEA